MELPKYVYFKKLSQIGRINTKPYEGRFGYKGTQYYCGCHETIRKAQIAVDRKRLYLGLEPIILKHKNNL